MEKIEYLVIDLNSENFLASRLVLPPGSTQFVSVSSALYQPTGESPSEIMAGLTKLIDAVGLKAESKIIFCLSHQLATTLRLPISLPRTDPKIPITEAELENLVSRGLWKLFNQKRRVSAVKMNVPDVEVKVCDADILGVRLDGHRVLDPIGFSAREITLQCQETLIIQPVLHALLQTVPQEQIISFQETGLAWPMLICAAGVQEEFLFLCVLAAETILYRYTSENLEFLDTLAWGSQDILKNVASNFGVAESEAEPLIDLYRSRAASPAVLKKLEAAITQELAILFQGIEAHRPAGKFRPVFISSQWRLPLDLLTERYLRRLDLHFLPTLLSNDWISEKFGYTLKLSEGDQEAVLPDSLFAALISYQTQNHEAPLAKLAKRRVRWL